MTPTVEASETSTFRRGVPPGSCTTWPETVHNDCFAEGVVCAAEIPVSIRHPKATIARRISDWTQEVAQWFPVTPDDRIRMTRVTRNCPVPRGCHDILTTVAALVLCGQFLRSSLEK